MHSTYLHSCTAVQSGRAPVVWEFLDKDKTFLACHSTCEGASVRGCPLQIRQLSVLARQTLPVETGEHWRHNRLSAQREVLLSISALERHV